MFAFFVWGTLLAVLLPALAQGGTSTCTSQCSDVICDPGYEPSYQLTSGFLNVTCGPCGVDFYSNATDGSACLACPDQYITELRAYISLVSDTGAIECVCPPAYFADENGNCVLCPTGVDCTDMGSTLAELDLSVGYWRVSDASDEILACYQEDACVGGTDVTAYCSEAFKGPLCSVCQNGYYSTGLYDCRDCGAGNKVHALLTIAIFAVVMFLFIAVIMRSVLKKMDEETLVEKSSGDASYGQEGNNNTSSNQSGATAWARFIASLAAKADTLMVKFKILVTHFQIISTFPAVLDVAFPAPFVRFASAFQIFNIDLWGILSGACLFQEDFYKNLIFNTLFPLCIIALLVVHYVVTKRTNRRSGRLSPQQMDARWNAVMAGALLTTFFFYINSSTIVLQTFNCEQFDDGSKNLIADYSKSCGLDSRSYKAAFGYALVMVAIFPIGTPLLYGLLLWKDADLINPAVDWEAGVRPEEVRSRTAKIQRTAFLWKTYNCGAVYFECWECVRKLLLTGLLVYFKADTSTQVVIAMLIALLSMRVLAYFRPFKKTDENNLAESALWVTTFTLLAALLIKSGVSEADGYNENALGAVLVFINIALIALAVLQTFWNVQMWLMQKLGMVDDEEARRRARHSRKESNGGNNRNSARGRGSGSESLTREGATAMASATAQQTDAKRNSYNQTEEKRLSIGSAESTQQRNSSTQQQQERGGSIGSTAQRRGSGSSGGAGDSGSVTAAVAAAAAAAGGVVVGAAITNGKSSGAAAGRAYRHSTGSSATSASGSVGSIGSAAAVTVPLVAIRGSRDVTESVPLERGYQEEESIQQRQPDRDGSSPAHADQYQHKHHAFASQPAVPVGSKGTERPQGTVQALDSEAQPVMTRRRSTGDIRQRLASTEIKVTFNDPMTEQEQGSSNAANKSGGNSGGTSDVDGRAESSDLTLVAAAAPGIAARREYFTVQSAVPTHKETPIHYRGGSEESGSRGVVPQSVLLSEARTGVQPTAVSHPHQKRMTWANGGGSNAADEGERKADMDERDGTHKKVTSLN